MSSIRCLETSVLSVGLKQNNSLNRLAYIQADKMGYNYACMLDTHLTYISVDTYVIVLSILPCEL